MAVNERLFEKIYELLEEEYEPNDIIRALGDAQGAFEQEKARREYLDAEIKKAAAEVDSALRAYIKLISERGNVRVIIEEEDEYIDETLRCADEQFSM